MREPSPWFARRVTDPPGLANLRASSQFAHIGKGMVEMRDTTKGKPADEELLNAWMETPLLITFVVQNGAFVSFNDAFARATGYKSSEVHAIGPSSLVYPADKSLVRTRATEMLKKRSVAPYEHRGITKTGEVRWLRELFIIT